MAWVAITTADVLNRMSDDERYSYENAGGNADNNRLTGIIAQVTGLVRGKVAACHENIAKMGDAGTIPDELLWAAVTIIRQSLVSSTPVLDSEKDGRTKELENSWDMLDQVASCKLRINAPEGELSASTGTYGGNDLLEF